MSLGIEDLHKALHELFVPEFFSAAAANASRSVSSSKVALPPVFVGVSVSRTQKSGSRSRDLHFDTAPEEAAGGREVSPERFILW